MWQLSFPMTEKEAKKLSAQGPKALREKQFRTQWHDPIPQILLATQRSACQDILYMIANYYTQGY
jgi:hypothetical protein